MPDRILIGHLNKADGRNGYKPIPIGTPVYEEAGTYHFDMELESTGAIHKLKFYKESLSPIIDFINMEHEQSKNS